MKYGLEPVRFWSRCSASACSYLREIPSTPAGSSRESRSLLLDFRSASPLVFRPSSSAPVLAGVGWFGCSLAVGSPRLAQSPHQLLGSSVVGCSSEHYSCSTGVSLYSVDKLILCMNSYPNPDGESDTAQEACSLTGCRLCEHISKENSATADSQ